MDTLSWARLGARVTGVDFSDKAIALARGLALDMGLAADFVCCDLYDLPKLLTGQFDIVFTSYGVLSWLRDLPRWGQIVAHYLKPGGTFYIVELHPLAFVFDDAQGVSDLRVAYSYFPQGLEPTAWPVQGTYADRTAQVSQPVAYEWTYTLGDVLNALIGAGLRIEFLHEFPVCVDQMLPCMEQGADGWFRLKEKHGAIPFLFSVKATKSYH
jgi:SAM-dependent methyltransferase